MELNENDDGNELDILLGSEALGKPCEYPKCSNSLPRESEFRFCEVCRTLTNRNSIAILLDPAAPFNDRRDMHFTALIHNMRNEEKINAIRKIEWLYLELQKQLKDRDLEIHRAQKFQAAMDEVNNERSGKSKAKAESKGKGKLSKKDKLAKTLGSAELAKELMEDDYSELL